MESIDTFLSKQHKYRNLSPSQSMLSLYFSHTIIAMKYFQNQNYGKKTFCAVMGHPCNTLYTSPQYPQYLQHPICNIRNVHDIRSAISAMFTISAILIISVTISAMSAISVIISAMTAISAISKTFAVPALCAC